MTKVIRYLIGVEIAATLLFMANPLRIRLFLSLNPKTPDPLKEISQVFRSVQLVDQDAKIFLRN